MNIFVHSYHLGNNLVDLVPGIQKEKIWDGWDNQFFSDRFSEPLAEAFYEWRINNQMETGVLTVTPTADLDADLYLVKADTGRKYMDKLAGWMEEVVVAAEQVSGDDEFFDYYPDNWDVALQIYKALGLEVEYQEARDRVIKGRYAGEEENIPSWS